MRLTSSPAGSCLAAALTGCAFFVFECDTFADYGAPRDSITVHLGNSVANNIAVQTVDPWPRYVGDARIDVDGQRLMIGIARYKANKSIPPRGLSTQSISITPTNGLSISGN